MNGNCTCGVELVDGARFCHKCGRPVDGFEPVAEPEEVVAAPLVAAVVPPPLPPVTVGFRNKDTMRAALLALVVTFIPTTLVAQVAPALMVGGLVVNGLLGVLFYLRRTARGMTTIEGARQGWISGLVFSGVTFLMMGVSFLFADKGELIEIIRKQAKAQGTWTPEAAKVMEDPAFLTGALFIVAMMMFVLFTSLASVGGMLGARLFGSNTPETGSKLG